VAQILTGSEFTRSQIIEWAAVPEDRVWNVGCGVGAAYRPGEQSDRLPFPYLLCVSNRKRHKNEFRVVDAFATSSLAEQLHLVFTGNPTRELREFIEQHHVTREVYFAGTIPEEKLPSLYGGAQALIFPSLYEGFGLPLLEAMACGTPVLTSNVTAMPEVAGDAALLVDPTSVEEISVAMRKIVSDSSLREQLQRKGRERAGQFTWSNTARRVRERLG